MYSVSDAYKTKLHSSVHTTTLSGTIGSTSFTDADVLDLTITNQCSDTNEVSLGSVYTGELKMTLRYNFPISRTSWKNSTVTLSEGLKINSSITELVPLGVFIISECTFSLTGIDITAYDAMIKFDKAYSGIINGTPYSILSKACNKCGVVLKNTEYDFSDKLFFLVIPYSGLTFLPSLLTEPFAKINGILPCSKQIVLCALSALI